MGLEGPKESYVRWGSRYLWVGAVLGKGAPVVKCRTFCRQLCKMAEPIDLPFGLWIRVGERKHEFNCICQVAPICLMTLCPELCKHSLTDQLAIWAVDLVGHIGTTCANTIEPTICCGSASLCQIIFTTCLLSQSLGPKISDLHKNHAFNQIVVKKLHRLKRFVRTTVATSHN